MYQLKTHLTNNTLDVMATAPSAIVGTIRFSLVLEGSNFFPQLSALDYGERKEAIFDRARLMRRFQVFENVCLPSLANQTDPNFNITLATSQELPDWALDRLNGLVRDLPNVYVHAFSPAANIRRIFKRSVFEMLDPEASIYASFRLDDDDAIANDFIERLRSHMTREKVGKVITFSHGHQLEFLGNAIKTIEDDRALGSVGLSLIQKGGVMTIPETNSVYCLGGHRKIGQLANVVNDESPSMFVQTTNGANISARSSSGSWNVTSAKDLARKLQRRFPHLDEETLNRLCVVYPS